MSALDLDSGLDLERLGLPISNTENKLLEAELQKKQKAVSSHEIKISEHRDRIQAVGDHLKNVKQELQHTQGLLEARKREVETEDHMRQIADREEGRLKGDMKRLNLEKDDHKDKRNTYENNIYHAKHKTEELKARMNWDQQALEAWLEESARQDDDTMAIAKYARADEGKVKELSLRMEHLHNLMVKKKKILNNELIETVTSQIELDKTAECFRTAHQEREDLIDQWEQTIEQMQKRDMSMDKCANELARLKMEIFENEILVREKQVFLDHEKENNYEMDRKLTASERLSAKNRLEYQATETARIQVKDELETLKYSVDRTAADLESNRGRSAHLTKEIKDKRKKLETLTKQRELMQLELKRATQKTLTAEEQARSIDQVLEDEEARVSHLEKKLSKLKEKEFSHVQELFELKQKDGSMEAEIHGGKASLRNLGSNQHRLDEELLKQQEILYTQDFQLQQLRHKLSRMEGERTGEELEILIAKIKDLEEEWERQQSEELLVQSQLKRVQEDLRRINRDIAKGLNMKLSLEDKIDEMNLHIDTTQRELKKSITFKQNKMVDENIIKLEVKRLRDHLFSHADEVQSLEKRKLQLDTAMSERMREIAIHKDMLRAQLKAIDTDRQTVSSELHKQISRIDRLRKRYEIITVSMNPPEGEEQHSQAYYVIKAAQEREELQRKGDDLDAKIKKAEKEIRAMENTLLLMTSKNTLQRKSLARVDKSGDEVIHLESLEGRWRAAQDKFKNKRRNVRQTEDDMQVMGRTLSSLKEDEIKLTFELQDKQNMLASLTAEMEELKAKHDRVSLQTTKLVKELTAMHKVSGHTPTHVQRDIELRELRDFGSNMVQQLGTVGSKNSEMVPSMQLMFSQAGLPPAPSPAGSRASSQPSSTRSSASGRSSLASHFSVTPTTPLQTTTVDIGGPGIIGGGSTSSTPRAGMSPHSSASSLGQAKPSLSKSSLAGQAKFPSSQTSLMGEAKPSTSKTSLTGKAKPPSSQTSLTGEAKLSTSKTSLMGQAKPPSSQTMGQAMSKTSLTGVQPQQSSRPSSIASSSASSRQSQGSRVSQASRLSQGSRQSQESRGSKELDLTIRPSSGSQH